jgi:hypothetical protein
VFIVGGTYGSLNPFDTQGGTLAVGGYGQFTANNSGHLYRIVHHVRIFGLRYVDCSDLTDRAAACHHLQKMATIIEGKTQ